MALPTWAWPIVASFFSMTAKYSEERKKYPNAHIVVHGDGTNVWVGVVSGAEMAQGRGH